MRSPVSLHISLSPGDLPHARQLLPHQLRACAKYVSEVVLTMDGGERAAPDLEPFKELAAPFLVDCPNWQIRAANHALGHRLVLGKNIFGIQRAIPHRTYRRGPSLSYYDGWAATTHPYIFHLDSDMFLGGDIGAWLAASIALMETDSHVFTCSPLAGPPRADHSLNQSDDGVYPKIPYSHCFKSLSTRLFLIRRGAVTHPEPPLPWEKAAFRNRMRAHLEGLPRLDLPENIITRRMRATGVIRVDHPGPGAPAFSLHPPHRNDVFYRRLTELITRAETNDYPDTQRGCYDVNEALIDWSPQIAAISKRRWWRVLLARLKPR